jgi:flagellar biosynthesis protein FliP
MKILYTDFVSHFELLIHIAVDPWILEAFTSFYKSMLVFSILGETIIVSFIKLRQNSYIM